MSTEGQDSEPAMELTTVYVGVEDMDRALEFYEALFGTAPAQADDRFSTFAFDGVDFGLYDASADGGSVEFGDNCVPNFEVEDVDAEFERVSELAPEVVHGIVDIDGYRCFHVRDTEGNTVEIFGVDSA
ncbi:Lactoylglutathione lyase (LGUL) family protein, diverged [Halosimplex carlsbadense 2-9-1]|uniref:Lactoylglutathione lyase (LGUL) family protein, diverged n=1 Tax=Halosimplex carlsbadense 2-9-1 TaxID=797114 RepID=M0D274_9EURY|nr:VOC family protein [Halosimplex carlsbadense]ELZ28797.1 Lactoylglutathione lyase (LGUL) family protein, diverged [Halosimplex carlsbadense 2-9-1]